MSKLQSKHADVSYFHDPGYEPGYPPEPELCLTKYKRTAHAKNGDDEDDDDDDADNDRNVHQSESKNNKMHRRNNEVGGKFHTKTGTNRKKKFILSDHPSGPKTQPNYDIC